MPPAERPTARVEDLGGYNAAARGEATDKARNFIESVSFRAAIGNQEIGVTHAKGGRASYQNGNLYIAKGDGPEIVAHEWGHHLEENAAIRERVQAFSAARFGSEKPVDMASVAPKQGYKPGEEQGRKDAMEKLFGTDADGINQSYYAGKTYTGGRSEVLSMGMEQLYRDPVHFAKADPEYFALVVGVLQIAGAGKGGKK